FARPSLELGCLEFLWSLVLGPWSFPRASARGLLRFRQLAAFLRALAARLGTTRERLDLRMLVERLGQLLTGARAYLAKRIGVLGTALQHLARQGRDPRAIPRRHDHRRDRIDIRLGQPRCDHPFAAPPR